MEPVNTYGVPLGGSPPVVLLLAAVTLASSVAAVLSELVAPPPLVPALELALELVPEAVDPALVELVLAESVLTALELDVSVLLDVDDSVDATGAASPGGLSQATAKEPKVRSAGSCRMRLECIEPASHRMTNDTSG